MMNSRGVVTLNFMFALIIGAGMSTILFAMSMTLMVVEVTQYVTYSAARAHAGGNKNPAEQQLAALNKYNSLITSSVLGPFYSNGWFTVSPRGSLEVRSGNTGSGTGLGSFRNEYPSATQENRENWTGVRTTFVAKVLSMKLPLIGSTTEDDEGLSTRILSVLIREPSQEECQLWMKERFQKMMALDPRYSSGGYGSKFSNYTPMEDNGC